MKFKLLLFLFLCFGFAAAETVFPPGNFVVSTAEYNRVGLAWDKGANADSSGLSYRIYRSNERYRSSARDIASTSATYIWNFDLDTNTTYYFWARAVLGGDISDFSDSVCVTTQGLPASGAVPVVPENLRCLFEDESYILVTWSAGGNNPNNINGYKLYQGTTNDTNEADLVDFTQGLEYEIGELSQTTYYFWVKAVSNNYEESGFSEMLTVDMGEYIYPPQSLEAVISGGSVRLIWTCDSGIVKVYRSESSDFVAQTLVLESSADTAFDASACPPATYYYHAYDSLDGRISCFGDYAQVSLSTFSPPDSFQVAELEAGSVTLKWGKADDSISSYLVYRYLDGVEQLVDTTTDTFYVDSTPVCGLTYTYKLRALANWMSNISSEVSATVPLKDKSYYDYVFLPDADSNGYNETAILYKKGSDSSNISITDVGSGLVIKSFYLGTCQPNSLAEIDVDGTKKLLYSLDTVNYSDKDTTMFRMVDVGITQETFVISEPTDLQATPIAFDQVKLTWSRGANTDTVGIGYAIYSSQTSDSNSAQLVGFTYGTIYTNSGLGSGEGWYYWVRAEAGLEHSGFAGPASVTVNQMVAPSNFTTRSVSGTKVVLQWSYVAYADGYNVYRDGGFFAYTTADSLADTAVYPLGQYSYQIASVYGALTSALSSALNVSVPHLYAEDINPVRYLKDADLLPDLDDDSIPEVAFLGIDSVNEKPTIVVRNADTNKILTVIPFFSTRTFPFCIYYYFPDGSEWPVFTVMGKEMDSVKTETRDFHGVLLPE